MNWYGRFMKSVGDALERGGRIRALGILQSMDPDFLREHGYSPELLREGLAAWPWRMEQVAEAERMPAADADRLADQELNAYTDEQLDDLGISRSGIADAVRCGRPGTDDIAA